MEEKEFLRGLFGSNEAERTDMKRENGHTKQEIADISKR